MITLKQYLTNVLAESFIPKHEECGLCFNIEEECGWAARSLFQDYCCKWPDATLIEDEDVVPVEGTVKAYRAASEAGTLWQNPRRYELAKWVLEQLS